MFKYIHNNDCGPTIFRSRDYFCTSSFDLCRSLSSYPVRHPTTLLRYAHKRIVNIMKVYIERNNLQLECDTVKIYFIHVYICEATGPMQYRPPNAYQVVTNINHFVLVSDSLGRLAAARQYRASDKTTKWIGDNKLFRFSQPKREEGESQ